MVVCPEASKGPVAAVGVQSPTRAFALVAEAPLRMDIHSDLGRMDLVGGGNLAGALQAPWRLPWPLGI